MELSKNFIEIERKFLFRGTFDSSMCIGSPKNVQRYYVYSDDQIDVRVQQKNDDEYELERRVQDPASRLMRSGMKMPISKSEFDRLKSISVGHPIHYRKHQTKFPRMFLKEYRGQLAGLVLVEVEFHHVEDALQFRANQEWVGGEITDSPYSRDSGLMEIPSWDELKRRLNI